MGCDSKITEFTGLSVYPLHSLSIPSTFPQYTPQYTLYIPSVYPLHSLSISPHSLSIPSTFPQYTLYIPSVYPLHSLSIPSTFPQYIPTFPQYIPTFPQYIPTFPQYTLYISSVYPPPCTMTTHMAVGNGESLHTDCAVSLRPLASREAQSVLWFLVQEALLFCQLSHCRRIYLGRTFQLTSHHSHGSPNLLLG